MKALASMIAAAALAAPLVAAGATEPEPQALRVCADPNNLPFSNEREEGFENRIADVIADELGAKTEYYWHAQRRGFIRKTLKANKCDLVIGVPAGYEMAATTEPYYRSTYVWTYPKGRAEGLASMTDPRLRDLKVGVHLIGDDGSNTPPAHALGAQGIVDNVAGYLIYGDYRDDNPPARLVEAAATGDVDVAAVWGPLAGYFADRMDTPMEVHPITDTDGFAPLAFEFSIAMATRRGDDAFRQRVEQAMHERKSDIDAILSAYGVPVIEEKSGDAL